MHEYWSEGRVPYEATNTSGDPMNSQAKHKRETNAHGTRWQGRQKEDVVCWLRLGIQGEVRKGRAGMEGGYALIMYE